MMMFLAGALCVGASFIAGFYTALRLVPKGEPPRPLLPVKKGGSAILEYGDPSQAEY